MLKVFFILVLIALSGCSDRYQEGYEQGFSDATTQATAVAEQKCQETIEQEMRSCRAAITNEVSSYVQTTVCGGGGVNVGKRHYASGKTGCVRVFSDGRVEQY